MIRVESDRQKASAAVEAFFVSEAEAAFALELEAFFEDLNIKPALLTVGLPDMAKNPNASPIESVWGAWCVSGPETNR